MDGSVDGYTLAYEYVTDDSSIAQGASFSYLVARGMLFLRDVDMLGNLRIVCLQPIQGFYMDGLEVYADVASFVSYGDTIVVEVVQPHLVALQLVYSADGHSVLYDVVFYHTHPVDADILSYLHLTTECGVPDVACIELLMHKELSPV